MGLARSLARVQDRIADACARAHRDPASVTLVAVSKTVPPPRIRELLACGDIALGESRVQEALGKIPEVGTARWHLVGHLQKNKARHVVGVFEMIHSVDDLALAQEIDRRARASAIVQPILVQVNLSREETKSGVAENEALGLVEAIRGLESLDVRGLMTIPPPGESAEQSRPWFARLRTLRDEIRTELNQDLPDLSMGMTDDFEVAIAEGATIVRVGRAIFGERQGGAA
jgi:pyridoxal phosphate enzyme (YggS family)